MAERGRPRSFDRAAALRRAMEVFWAKGYDSASMADLTAAMGIAAPSLYAAFGSKEGLFREALQLYGTTEGLGIWGGLDSAPTARAAVEGFLTATADAFSEPGKPPGCMVVLSAVNATGTGPDLCQDLRRDRADGIARLRARLERAVAEGELPPGFDSAAAADFYVTVQQGMSIRARDGAPRESLAATARCALAAWDAMAKQ